MTERSDMIPGLVSVVVCAYNNWPDLEMTIESALHQSYQPIEVIVVDNSSTDITAEEVAKRFGRSVRYIRQYNRGDSGAYNAGFDVACGEFIQFVDGDDVLAPNKIEKQLEVFRSNPELGIVYGDVRMFQTSDGPANWDDPPTREEDDMMRALLTDRIGICALGTLFRRSALEKVGHWDESLYVADLDYLLRAAWAGCRFGRCPVVPMGFAREHPGQMTKNNLAMARGLEAVWEKALTYVTREPYRSLTAVKLAQRRYHMAVHRNQMSRREALAKLSLARATSPEAVSVLEYAVGYATIVLPGGAVLARSGLLGPMRRALARVLPDRKPRALNHKIRSSGVGAERGA